MREKVRCQLLRKKEEEDQRCSPLVRMLHLRLRETTVVCQSPLMPIEGGEEEEEEEGPRQCQCSELEFSTAGCTRFWMYQLFPTGDGCNQRNFGSPFGFTEHGVSGLSVQTAPTDMGRNTRISRLKDRNKFQVGRG